MNVHYKEYHLFSYIKQMTTETVCFSVLHVVSFSRPRTRAAVFRVNFHIRVRACVRVWLRWAFLSACDALLLLLAAAPIHTSSRVRRHLRADEWASGGGVRSFKLCVNAHARGCVLAVPVRVVREWGKRRGEPSQRSQPPLRQLVTWGRGGGKRRSSWNEPRPGPRRRLIGPRSESRAVAFRPVIDRRWADDDQQS